MFTNKAYTYTVLLCLCLLLLPYRILASSTTNNNSQDKPSVQQNDHNKDESLINEDIFIQYIDEAANNLQQLDSNNPVLFLGPTGAGKSTTICSLLFGKLDKIKEEKFYEGQLVDTVYNIDIKDAKGKPHPKIGHARTVSCTVFPACYPLKAHNLDLCDFAGIFDSGGIEKRTAIAITSSLFLKRSKNIKAIVFVMSESDLESSKAHIMNQVIQGLQKMFGNPLPYVDSIFFALTKSSYSPAKFRYTIHQLRESIKKQKDKPRISNNKTLYDLLDVMLKKHKAHFLVVNPLEENSSKLIIARLEQSKGFPSKAIRFIGDQGINRASCHFFTKCAREGKAILDIYNTYPKAIEAKNEDIIILSSEISILCQEIDDCKNGKEHKKITANLIKCLALGIEKDKKDLAALIKKKAAKEKYIRDHDHDTLIAVGGKTYPKIHMNRDSKYEKLDKEEDEDGYSCISIRKEYIYITPENGSFYDVVLEFDKANGKIVDESMYPAKVDKRIKKLTMPQNTSIFGIWQNMNIGIEISQISSTTSRHAYMATYQCNENGGSDLQVTLREQSRVLYRKQIKSAKKRLKKLTEIEIPAKKEAIAVAQAKVSLMRNLLAVSKTPTNLVEKLEVRKESRANERSLLQNQLAEMQKELTDKEKLLRGKQKLFETIEETYGFLGFTYGDIADFVKEYRSSKNRAQKAMVLTSGYIRKSIEALPQRKKIQYNASNTIYRLVCEYHLGFNLTKKQQRQININCKRF